MEGTAANAPASMVLIGLASSVISTVSTLTRTVSIQESLSFPIVEGIWPTPRTASAMTSTTTRLVQHLDGFL